MILTRSGSNLAVMLINSLKNNSKEFLLKKQLKYLVAPLYIILKYLNN